MEVRKVRGGRGKREGEETATPDLAMVIQQTQLETPKAIESRNDKKQTKGKKHKQTEVYISTPHPSKI